MNRILDFIFYHTPLFYLTQSIWRDEAFSYFMALSNPINIIVNTANDFNPPLYYLLLHVWIYIAGHSDIGLRMLSFLLHLIGVYFAYLLGKKLSDKKHAIYLAAFYFFNPMLLYYAFEMRMYSLYALFATSSIYYFYVKNWRGYIISSALGLYSHSFFALLIASLSIYHFIRKKNSRDFFRTITPLLLFIPWVPVLAIQFIKSKESWLFPVDIQLIKSSLGNLFTSYEGTPGNLWLYTALLSLAIIIFIYKCFKNKKLKGLIFVLPVMIPLSAILLYSAFKRPLYVNRYLIFITVFEVFSIFIGIISIKNSLLKKTAAFLWLLVIMFFNIYLPPFREKTDFKSTFTEINKIATKEDQVYARTPIAYLESRYYYKNPENTFVYNLENIHIPNYIGVNVLFPSASRSFLPLSPIRVFMVNDDASYDVIITQQ